MRGEAQGAGLNADVVVIGSGPGGAVTAALWAEAGRSVLMIEEGEHLPLASAPHFSRDEILQKYRTGGIAVAFGAAQVAYVEGRVVGGGSEVNRGLYHRAPADILERWSRDFGVEALDPHAMATHFEACEATAKVEYLPGAPPGLSLKLHEGAGHLGWRSIEAPRLFRYGGAGGGTKQSMSETFVPRFLAAGGRLRANLSARRIRRMGGTWFVEAEERFADGRLRSVEIRAKLLFVCGGAVQTPALLRRSGLKRNIGDSLRFHPMLKVIATFADEVNRPGDLDPVHQIKEFEPGIGIGCSISKPAMLALAMVAQPAHMKDVEHDWRRMGLYYVQTGGGTASVRNIPGFRDPLVRVRRSAQDLAELMIGLRRLIEALFAAGAVTVYPAVPGFPVLRAPADMAKLPERLLPDAATTTSVHVFSSCPMGERRELTATDSFGRVHDTEDLYINDASLLCGPTGVNPQGTVMAVAHRNALEAISRHKFG